MKKNVLTAVFAALTLYGISGSPAQPSAPVARPPQPAPMKSQSASSLKAFLLDKALAPLWTQIEKAPRQTLLSVHGRQVVQQPITRYDQVVMQPGGTLVLPSNAERIVLYTDRLRFNVPPSTEPTFAIELQEQPQPRPASPGRNGNHGTTPGGWQDARHGHNGTPGEDGQPGGDGLPARFPKELYIVATSVELPDGMEGRIQLRISARSPSGGPGGNGGRGGNGGDGHVGNNANHGLTNCRRQAGNGGNGGSNGVGGRGGRGGDGADGIAVYLVGPKAAADKLALAQISIEPGQGGRGGNRGEDGRPGKKGGAGHKRLPFCPHEPGDGRDGPQRNSTAQPVEASGKPGRGGESSIVYLPPS